MYLYKMLLLAIQPMTIPSLMSETYMVHPSTQAFSLSSNETVVTNLPSTVDFVGTVEMTEPVGAAPAFPPTTFDAIQFAKYFAKSFAAEVKSAASVAAKEFCNEMTFKFNETTHAVMHEFFSDAMIASAPFRLATADLFDEIYVSVEESSDKFRAVAIDLWDAIHLKSEQVYEDFETLVGKLPSIAAQSATDIQSLVGDTFHMISGGCQMAFKELNAIDYSSVISDAIPAVSAAYNRAYAKLESLVFPEPEPAPTNLESIARDALDRIFLGFQRVHDLFAPATPPPPSFWDQPISTTYERLEVIVRGFFFAPPPPPAPRTFESVARDALDAFSVYCQEEVYEKLEDYFTGFFFFFTPPTPPVPPSSGSVPSIITIVELFHFILLEYQERTYNNDKMESSSNGIGDEETWTSKYLFDIVLDDVCAAPFIPNWCYLQYLLDEHKQKGDSLFCFIVSMELDLLPKLLGSDFLCENDDDDDHLSFAIVMGWNTSKSNERLADGRPSELFQPTLNCP